MNKREKFIRMKRQKALVREALKQFDRLTDNLVSGMKNLALAFRDRDEMNRISKMAACDDYMLEALEDVVTIRYAFTELAHRYWKIRRLDKEKAERLKLMTTPPMIVTPFPEWFDKVEPIEFDKEDEFNQVCQATKELIKELTGDETDGLQQGSETQA